MIKQTQFFLAILAVLSFHGCVYKTYKIKGPEAEKVKKLDAKPKDCEEKGLITVKQFISEFSDESDEFKKNLDIHMKNETAKLGGDSYRIKTMNRIMGGTAYAYFVEGFAYACAKK